MRRGTLWVPNDDEQIHQIMDGEWILLIPNDERIYRIHRILDEGIHQIPIDEGIHWILTDDSEGIHCIPDPD